MTSEASTKSLRATVADRLLLIGAAVLAAAFGVGIFAFADRYHVPVAWAFGILLGIGFVGIIGRSLRRRFRNPMFVLFFSIWTLVHVAVMLSAMYLWGLPGSIAAMIPELGIGYVLTLRLFGFPAEQE